eukprot:CAMPEP_0194723210 /NCGR_PEP_ID=MMETSP0296-20130528/14251_1 /TAXON_ID=39354 /ORGANISM="Heterosigma akashiwo, Strain CCMP2393" /LENGTH=81 /DNA_ID=CAMNT_0039626533 /DNA_START=97 /DNA_END=339 /DNA_ORIENTATION=+
MKKLPSAPTPSLAPTGSDGSTRAGAEVESASPECAVCMDAQKDTLIAPCGHVCCCNTCATILQAREDSCPVCRGQIEGIFK